MPIDPANYNAIKAAGAITSCTLNGDVITITSKLFGFDTGKQLADDVSIFSLLDFQNRVAYYDSQVTNFNQIITDCGG